MSFYLGDLVEWHANNHDKGSLLIVGTCIEEANYGVWRVRILKPAYLSGIELQKEYYYLRKHLSPLGKELE
jgi:hypothetical protein